MVVGIVLIMTLSAFVHGFFGFGFSAVALGLLTVNLPTRLAVAYVVSLAPISTVASALIQHRKVSYRGTLPLALGALLFFPLGVWLLFIAPEVALHIALGTVVLVAALMQLFPGKIRLFPPGLIGGAVAAALSGLFGGAIATPGLTMTAYIYGKETDQDVARASLQFFFLFTTAVAAVTHGIAGTITRATLTQALYAAIPSILALYAGISLARRVDTEKLRYLYAGGLAIMGLYILGRAVF